MGNEYTFCDLFSGIDGFRLGLEREGFRCIGSCEVNESARAIHAKNFGSEPEWSDATKLDAAELPDFEVLCAGFPCQAFSHAGKRLGFEDARGTLFFEVARIAREKRPRILLLENVRGLLSHDEGRTFGTILSVLDELRYDVEWWCINGRYFLPQNRERVFIVCHARENPTRKIFPIFETDGMDKEGIEGQAEQVVNCIDANYWKGTDKHGQRTMIAAPINFKHKAGDGTITRERQLTDVVPALQAHAGHSQQSYVVSGLIHSRGFETRDDALSHCLKGGGGGSRNFVAYSHPIRHLNRNQLNFEPEIAMTIDTMPSNGVMLAPADELSEAKIRRLTPLECERLQGFPDGWTEGVAETHRYRLLGNAVMPPVTRYLGNAIKAVLS